MVNLGTNITLETGNLRVLEMEDFSPHLLKRNGNIFLLLLIEKSLLLFKNKTLWLRMDYEGGRSLFQTSYLCFIWI